MIGLLQGLREGINGNLSALEAAALLVLAALVWLARKRFPVLPVVYSVFLVLYITLLRRAPGYDEEIRWHLAFWTSAGLSKEFCLLCYSLSRCRSAVKQRSTCWDAARQTATTFSLTLWGQQWELSCGPPGPEKWRRERYVWNRRIYRPPAGGACFAGRAVPAGVPGL